MSDREYIKSLVKGAEIYRKQGLYAEAREKYVEALSCVSEQGDQKEKLKEAVEHRIRLVDEWIAESSRPDEPPELSPDVQDLIKNLFSSSATREGAAFEGPLALMRFGQYKRAMEEFERLLDMGIQPLVVARNIITCSLLLGSPEIAVERFRKWCARSFLNSEELLHIRDFLKSALLEKGVVAELPFPPERSAGGAAGKGDGESEPEVSNITLEFEDGPLKGTTEELKVTFQFANVLSVIIPWQKKALIQFLRPGTRLNRVGFYSTLVFFRGAGKVTSRTTIKHGPRKGDCLFDISIDEG